MATPQALPAGRIPSVLELLALDRLPCGCVAAAYRARLWDLAVIAVEAKGPHCPHAAHAQGRMLEVGQAADLTAGDGSD